MMMRMTSMTVITVKITMITAILQVSCGRGPTEYDSSQRPPPLAGQDCCKGILLHLLFLLLLSFIIISSIIIILILILPSWFSYIPYWYQVLRHPVVKTFIERRWKRTRSIFLVSFFLYLTFVLLFSRWTLLWRWGRGKYWPGKFQIIMIKCNHYVAGECSLF